MPKWCKPWVVATQIGPDLGGHEEEARSSCKEHRGRGSVIVTVCVSFDPTVSEACDQNQNQNLQGLSKKPTWKSSQLQSLTFGSCFGKVLTKEWIIPFRSQMRCVPLAPDFGRRFWLVWQKRNLSLKVQWILVGTDCTQWHGGSWNYIFGTAPLCSNLTTILYSHFICSTLIQNLAYF